MADGPGTLELVARELAAALAPLEQQLADGSAEALLTELGVRLPAGVGTAATAVATVAVKAADLAPIVVALTDAIDDEDAARIAAEGIALIGALRDLLEALGQLEPAFDAALAAAAGLTAPQRARLEAAVGELPERLLHMLLLDYLHVRAPGAYSTLRLVGVIDDEIAAPDTGDPTAPPLRRRALHLDRFVDGLTQPDRYLRDTFGLGDPSFDGLRLYPRIVAFLEERDLGWSLLTPPGRPPILEAFILRFSTDPATAPPSLTARLRVPATQDFVATHPLGELWSLTTEVRARFEGGLEANVSPPLDVTLAPPSGALALDAAFGLQARRDGAPMLLLGQSGASRVELDRFAVSLGLRATAALGAAVTVEPSARAELDGGHILIDLSAGDGFISAITGGGRIESNFDLRALWAPSSGLLLEGSAAIEIAIPTHVALGPIEITTLYVRTTLAPDGSLPTELSAGFKAALGPLQASVDRIGLTVTTRVPGEGGNLGPLDLSFAFKPPNGVGLVVDAGVVKGGGYLFIDTDRGEYAGALELDFAGIVELKAIGLINTRMPDGSAGFSLLIVITAEFGSGIQLGFGFTLLGVGGILGLNRSMALAPLIEGVRGGAVERIMFPRDVVANAPQIISDLRTLFPVEEGTFVIGPMAKLGWGTPTLVSLSLGIIIEIPGNVAIIGVLEVALPDEDVAIIHIQVAFAGAIEFDRKRVYFFAAMFDSRILFLTLEGEMGVLAAFGDDADFVLSVGGFHPSFDPPPLPFPSPRRIAIDILNTPTQKLRVEGYLAVTTNTLQFGARVDLRLGFSECGVEGHVAFDALVQFRPLYFIVSISASVSLKVFGIGLFSVRLRFELSGPKPWRAKGSASLSLLFFDIEVDFDVTWGDRQDTELPPVSVLPLLKAELEKAASWRALPPPGADPLVSLRKLDTTVDALVLHPVGVLRVTQRALPLDLTMSRVGTQRPVDAKRLSVSVTSGGLAKQGDVDEQFAPAQFQDFGDAEKLSKPAFELMHGGLDLSVDGQQLHSGALVKRVVRYELITIDGAFRSHRRFPLLFVGLFAHFLAGNAASRSVLSQAVKRQHVPFEDKVEVAAGEEFAVAATATNAAVATFPSEAMAREHLLHELGADAALHVIPAYEAAARS